MVLGIPKPSTETPLPNHEGGVDSLSPSDNPPCKAMCWLLNLLAFSAPLIGIAGLAFLALPWIHPVARTVSQVLGIWPYWGECMAIALAALAALFGRVYLVRRKLPSAGRRMARIGFVVGIAGLVLPALETLVLAAVLLVRHFAGMN